MSNEQKDSKPKTPTKLTDIQKFIKSIGIDDNAGMLFAQKILDFTKTEKRIAKRYVQPVDVNGRTPDDRMKETINFALYADSNNRLNIARTNGTFDSSDLLLNDNGFKNENISQETKLLEEAGLIKPHMGNHQFTDNAKLIIKEVSKLAKHLDEQVIVKKEKQAQQKIQKQQEQYEKKWSQRIPLEVPYAEKKEAKALGAKWDRQDEVWYVPKTADLEKFQKWLNSPNKEMDKKPTKNHDEPQAQMVDETTPIQQPQELPSAVNKILINNYLENNGFEKGINVGSYRKQIDDNNLLVVGVANDVSIQSIQSVANNQVKEQETVLSSLTQNLSEDDIKQAFSQSKLWQAHLGQSVQPTIQAEQPTQPTPVAQQQQATAYTPNISQYDTKLNTPYAEKNQAKALGAKWDNANKTWYAPAGLDLNKFEKWLPKEKEQSKQLSDKLANSPAQTPQGQTKAIPQAQRLYLYTRPSDNEKMQELKAQGIIKFDLPNKLWYAHKDNAEAVKEWTTRPNVPTPEQALTDHLRSMGIKVDAGHPIFDERPHRLSNDGSTDKNVMYHAYANQGGVPYARITNFSRNGVSKWTYPAEHLHDLRTIEAVDRAMGQSYTNRPTPTIHTPQTAPQSHNLPQAQQEPPKDEAKIALENLMAQRAKMVMSFAPIADNNQNYLDKKQVTANGVAHIVPSSDKIPEHLQSHIAIGNTPKQYFWLLANNPENKLVLQRGNLVIPQYNAQGEMRAFETIAYNGRKYALKDAEKKSMMTVLGSLENGKPIVIAEGYATGATLHEHTGRNVVVAFGKNGLMDIAKELRDNYPDSKIYIGADNDHNKEQNYGLQNALAVQGAVKNVYVLAPQFEAGDTGKDWNDVLVDKGVDELKRQLTEQLLAINPDAKKTKQEIRAEPAHTPIQAPQDPLSLEVIKQNYPAMSDSNLQAIQAWKVEIDTRYTSDPYRQETSINRSIAKLPDLAQGEQLPFPKSQAMQEYKPPEPTVTAEATQPQTNQPTTPQAEDQHSINGGGGRKW